MKRIQRLLLCVLLCLAVLPVCASADTGPKPAVNITVVNAPAGDYYLDLLIQDPGDYPNIDPEDYDPTLLDGLRSWEGEGWWPALLEGTDVPLFGDLTPGEDGTHRFTYHGLPRTFRIAVSSAQGAQATESSFTRTVFYTHLTYNWATNTITKATSTVGFYLTQFLSTLIPTLLVEGALLWLFGFRIRQFHNRPVRQMDFSVHDRALFLEISHGAVQWRQRFPDREWQDACLAPGCNLYRGW